MDNGIAVYPIYYYRLKNGSIRLSINCKRDDRKLVGFGIAPIRYVALTEGKSLYVELFKIEDYNNGELFGVEVLTKNGEVTIALYYDISGINSLRSILRDYGIQEINDQTLQNATLDIQRLL